MNTTPLDRLLDEVAVNTDLFEELTHKLNADCIRRLVRIVEVQREALAYIANSSPGPEQRFETENKRAASSGISKADRIAEGKEEL